MSPAVSLSATVYLLVACGTHQPSNGWGTVLIPGWLYLIPCLIWITGPRGASCPLPRASLNTHGTRNSRPSA
ncbi:hypothetical protein ACU18_10510 [Arthrobacter sp. ZBG10]|nr:hypothetical protein ACU18_10510 [Arthrobacter sp. ZBG10]